MTSSVIDDILRNKWVGLAIALGVLLAAAFLVALGWLMWWYFRTSELPVAQRKDFIQGLASVAQALAVLFTGVVALLGLYFTRRNTDRQLAQARESIDKQLRQARESQERTEASAQATLRLTEQGQITERFTRAIDQLGATDGNGNKPLEIRLGGIYALERIARDSEEDHGPIMEVLTAYVREHAPWPPNPSGERTSETPDRRKPSVDIQAILQVLGRREEYRVPANYLNRLDLRRTNLSGANLSLLNFERVILLEANLKGANMFLTNFKEASFHEADFDGASLELAILEGAVLQGAKLLGVKGLTQQQIELASGDEKTELPEGLHRPITWVQSTDNRTHEGDEEG